MVHISQRLVYLVEHDRIQILQITGEIQRIILDEQDDSHKSDCRVVLHIRTVLDALDYGEENLRLAVPDEHLVDAVGGRHEVLEVLYVVLLVYEQVDRQVLVAAVYPFAQFYRLLLVYADHENDKVEFHGVQHVQRFLRRGYGCRSRQREQRELVNLAAHELTEEIVLALQDECVVKRGNEKDVLHLVAHHVQVDVLVEHLLVEEKLQRLTVLDVGLTIRQALLRVHKACCFVEHLASLVIVDVSADKAADVGKQTAFLFEERSVVHVREFPGVIHLNRSLLVVERHECLLDEPRALLEALAVELVVLIRYAHTRMLRILP